MPRHAQAAGSCPPTTAAESADGPILLAKSTWLCDSLTSTQRIPQALVSEKLRQKHDMPTREGRGANAWQYHMIHISISLPTNSPLRTESRGCWRHTFSTMVVRGRSPDLKLRKQPIFSKWTPAILMQFQKYWNSSGKKDFCKELSVNDQTTRPVHKLS